MKASGEEQISRKDFFTLTFRKIKDTTMEHIVKAMERVDDALDTEKDYVFVCNLDNMSQNEPRQVIVKGKPYFYMPVEAGIQLFQGLCPNDGFPLQYYKLQSELGCPLCGVAYSLKGQKVKGSEQFPEQLQAYPTKREENKLFAGF